MAKAFGKRPVVVHTPAVCDSASHRQIPAETPDFPMNAFIFTQRFNSPDSPELRAHNAILCVANGPAPAGVTPTHLCDATGSFQTGAGILRSAHHIPQRPFIYDNTLPAVQRRNSIFAQLETVPQNSLNLVAYFGHGTPNGLESAAIGRGQLARFAQLINDKCAQDANVVLFACSAGARGGFAEMLSREMRKNIWVFGHCSWGSYSNLSMFRRFPDNAQLTGGGGIYNFWLREREAAAQTLNRLPDQLRNL